ncbi:amino acid deaminase [Aeromicrobium terrae]|uniref:Amino acid deaminase n=1 Tax=Aeromicrobium terrae TaxID=2498846 RepID=A0A5C8NIP3_9ACTN|nr:amino acid deaminase [Aeromicrobium terrae]TXL60745.1 amino acid deaminase [Aeromicrobium terrae]
MIDRDRLESLGRRELDATVKGLPLADGDTVAARDVAARGWNVLAGDLDLPAMIIKEAPMASNIALMAEFCRQHSVSLAPHGKTSMAPQLFARQLDAGAWAITAATVRQCRTYRAFGVSRVLLANELVDPLGLQWLAEEMRTDPDVEIYFFVDSIDGVDLADAILGEAPVGRPVNVLIELGYDGGRCGCRSIDEALELAVRVNDSAHLSLCGVAGFEGLIPGPDLSTVLEKSTAYLGRIHSLVDELDAQRLLPAGEEIIVSAGGSSYFDLVADVLGPQAFDRAVRTVVRSGCYITHDVEMFELTSPLGARAEASTPRLEPAFELWATVLSRPEPGLAIVGFGKRDAPYDYGLPSPVRVVPQGTAGTRDLSGSFNVTGLNDQHAFVRIPADDPLAVGDVVVSGISHPCGAFDKWQYIPVVDESYDVVDGIFTFF